ncbi:MAG: RidA family protein [Bacteroidota bacterium]|jgi:2-iminobutanoate/2-iminopropanoate deaminase
MERTIIHTKEAPAPIGPYNQAVHAGNLVFLSGQVALDPVTGEMNNADLTTETHQVMKNVQAVLNAAGCDFSNVVKTTIFLSDMQLFAQVNEVYGSYFKGDYPARETVAVKGLPKNANVEISVIAAR